MKRVLPLALAVAIASLISKANAAPGSTPPGQVDFGNFEPSESGAQFVEVNLPGNLIALAARFVEKQEPDVAQLLTGIKRVHVNVVGVDESNRSDLQKRAQKVRKDLLSKGWERIVTAQKQDQEVGVYLKMDEKSTVQGLTVVVMGDEQQAVFVNIVGDIKADQLSSIGDRLYKLGEQFDIEPLKHAGKNIKKSEKSEKAEATEDKDKDSDTEK